MGKKQFSIIIPAYNAEKFIERCLDSVTNQSYDDYEIIIINDGSTDGTDAIVKNYIQNHSNILFKYEIQKNQGAAIARGQGIELAEGEYIAFLDADDIWYPKKLEVDVKYIEITDADVFYNDEYEVNLKGEKREIRNYQLGQDALVELITGGNPISTSTVVARTSFVKKNHSFFDGSKYGEDIACWISFAKAGAKFKHIPEILGEYIRNENSLTMNDFDYIEKTYSRLVSFCDDLLACGYSVEEVERIKKMQLVKKNYGVARFYHRKRQYKDACKWYRESLAVKFYKKAAAGYVLALLHI
jgi:glycosyltransferase involved in cell wall biosynthesis